MEPERSMTRLRLSARRLADALASALNVTSTSTLEDAPAGSTGRLSVYVAFMSGTPDEMRR